MRLAQLTRITRTGERFCFRFDADDPLPLLITCLRYQSRQSPRWSEWDTCYTMQMASLARLYGCTKLWDATPEPVESLISKFWRRAQRMFSILAIPVLFAVCIAAGVVGEVLIGNGK